MGDKFDRSHDGTVGLNIVEKRGLPRLRLTHPLSIILVPILTTRKTLPVNYGIRISSVDARFQTSGLLMLYTHSRKSSKNCVAADTSPSLRRFAWLQFNSFALPSLNQWPNQRGPSNMQ